MKNWPEVELGSYVDLLTGFPFKSKKYTDNPNDFRLISGYNVMQGYLRWDRVNRWPKAEVNGLLEYSLNVDDVVLAMDRPWVEAGLKYSWMKQEDLPCLLVQRTARLRGTDSLDIRFLRYLIGSPDFTSHVQAITTGTSVPHISPTGIKSFKFKLPPLSNQRRIAEILGRLDDKIEVNRRINRTLEAMAQALFKHHFVDFGPYQAGEFVESELGLIPKGWGVNRLQDHIKVTKGLSYKGKWLTNEGTPLHNLNSVYEGGGYKYEGIKFYDPEGDFKPQHLVSSGDLIVANTEQGFDYLLIGCPAIVPKRFGEVGLFTHHIYKVEFRVDSPLTVRWLYFWLKSPVLRQSVTAFTNGTTVNMLSRDGLALPKIVVPPVRAVRQFDKVAHHILEQIELNEDENCKLAEIRDYLLPKLLSGQVKVEDLESSLSLQSA